jgi:peptidoglycan/LPS O-acetylase OafA/YrhL
MLPAGIAAVISWVLAQLGAFTVANRADAEWLRYASPDLDPTFWMEVKRLYWNLVGVWTTGRMDYDDHQWSLLPLLKGSMLVYVVTSATIYCQPRYRMMVCFILMCYFYHCNEETFSMQSFFGMFMADLSNHPPAQKFIADRRYLRVIIAPMLIVFGLFIASYPKERPEWCGWSIMLMNWNDTLFPRGGDIPKYWTAMGLDFIILGIHLSPLVKEFLSTKTWLWLGKHSFAVYLIHGTLLRTVLVWMVYGITGQPWIETTNENGDKVQPPWLPIRGGRGMLLFWIPIWIALVYFCAHLWMKHVDAWCARITQRLEKHCFQDNSEAEKLPVAYDRWMNGRPNGHVG